MTKFYGNKIFLHILLFLVIIIEFIFLQKILSENFFFLDDIFSSFCYDDKNIFKFPYNGIFIASFFDRFFGFLMPYYLQVHPSEIKSVYFSCFGSFILILFSFIISNIVYMKNKLNFNYIIYSIFALFAILQCIQIQPLILFVYDGFFRMFFSCFLWGILFLLLLKNNFTTSQKVIIALMTFIVCISEEMVCFFTLAGLCIYTLLCNSKNKKFFQMLCLCSLLGFFVSIMLGAFFRKSENLLFDFLYLKMIFGDLITFIKTYIVYVFGKHILGIFILLSQIILLRKLQMYKVKNTIYLVLSFLFGILLFFSVLIFWGKSHYFGNFWLVHDDLHVIFSIVLFLLNSALLNLIEEAGLIKRYIINSILNFAAVILIINNVLFWNDFIEKEIKSTKIEYYKIEKIIRYAIKNQKNILLDKSYYDNAMLHPFYNPESSFIYFINVLSKNNTPPPQYDIIFTDKEKADKAFIENSGHFDEEELKNINFNNLYKIN